MVKYGYKAQIRLSTKRAVRERSIKIFLTKEKTKMKKRRTLIISLLLIAALALGIGYAGFTSELTISGDAVINSTTTSQVVIEKVEINSKSSENIKLNFSGEGTKTVNADLTGFATTQDYVVLDVTVSNPHEFPVTISEPMLTAQNNEITGGSKYFDIEILNAADIPGEIAAAEYVSGTLTPKTITFQYKISAKTIPADAHTVSYTITANASTRTNPTSN